MVWGFFPVDPLSGENKYYIYAKGAYKVGRKGCDVTVGNDKGVSRVHAEIIVDDMEPFDSLSSSTSSKVRIRDCSKYGTVIDRDSYGKERVHECPGREMYLKDGDLVSFGTGTVTFRFCYVPLKFYLCNFTSSQGTPSTQDRVSSIGAHVTHEWTTQCTHVIVDPFMPVTEGIIDAILSKKPLVLSTWLEFVATNRIRNEIPSYSSYIPTLTLDGASVTVADYRTRENCLRGYTFLLDSKDKYRFQDRMQALLEVSGANVISIEDFDSNSQDPQDADSNRLVLVNPSASTDNFRHRNALSKVNEVELISSVISGYLDSSIIISPSILISSSCSTGETIVAESDAETETETATSEHPIITHVEPGNACEQQKSGNMESLDVKPNRTPVKRKIENQEHSHFVEPNKAHVRAKVEDLDSVNVDILYSQNLIVRHVNPPSATSLDSQDGIINFKRFRKTNTQSGNSFSNLVPFAKYPYNDSDYDKELSEHMKEEKRRKQMEAMAEDLFNTEKGRRRGVAGSLRGLLGQH
ncbi:nibrin homolog [Silene latifolia]|uniref:nibrin homolog n=1 Tax=Silene latifolia TaxID=37657 RepID=UPI003D77B873